MAICAACGVELNPTQKFCRQCGASVGDGSPPAAEDRTCRQCGHSITPSAKFCRQCGADSGASADPVVATAPSGSEEPAYGEWTVTAAASDDTTPLRRRRAPREPAVRPWVYIASGIAALVALTTAGYFAWPVFLGDPQPDDGTIAAALAEQLPPFVQLQNARVQAIERIAESPMPAFGVAFSANATVASTVYLRSRVEDGIVFLGEPIAAGTPIQLSGAGTVRRSGEEWSSELALEQHPLLSALSPQLLAGTTERVIVEGSAEEASFVAERERAREAAEQQAAYEKVLAEQLREAENARREAQRLAEQAAAIERARLEADRQAQIALAERKRVEAEQQARADALQREQAEANRRQQAEAAAARAAVITTGRVPRNTETTVQTTTALRSDTVRVEDRFEAVAAEDLVVDGRVLVPSGSILRGVVTSVRPATRTNRTARMELSFDQLTIGTRSFPIRARATRVLSGPGLKGDAAKAGIGAGVGALIGGLLGGTQGAVLGGAIGAGGTIAATEGKEIDLPPGTNIRVKFESAVDIQ